MKFFRRHTVTPPDDLPAGDLLKPAAPDEIIKQIDELLRRSAWLEESAPGSVDALLDYRNKLREQR